MELEADYVSAAVPHSMVGASSAYRWMNCAGSPNLITKLGPKVKGSGIEAAKGTAAHTVLSTCLETGTEPWEMAGQIIEVGLSKFEVDDDMVKAVSVCTDFIASLVKQHPDCDVYIEEGVAHPDYPDIYGTTDFGLMDSTKIVVVDYKHGEGVVVEPTSPQLKYYAKLLLTELEMQGKVVPDEFPIEMWIVQPRIPHREGQLRKHEMTAGELRNWFDLKLLPAYFETKRPDALLTVGEWCRFCPARDLCPALKYETLAVDMTLEPDHLTNDELGKIMQKADAITTYLETLKKEAFKRIVSGKRIPGYKLVRKKANRTWKKDAEGFLMEALGADAYEPIKLKSPPQIEKMPGGEKLIARWAYTPDAGLTIAKSSDPRVELKPAMDLFLETQANLDGEIDISS